MVPGFLEPILSRHRVSLRRNKTSGSSCNTVKVKKKKEGNKKEIEKLHEFLNLFVTTPQ